MAIGTRGRAPCSRVLLWPTLRTTGAPAATPPPEQRETALGAARIDEDERCAASALVDARDIFACTHRAGIPAPIARAGVVDRETAGQRAGRGVDVELIVAGRNSHSTHVHLIPRSDPCRRRNGGIMYDRIDHLLRGRDDAPSVDEGVFTFAAATATPEPGGGILDLELDLRPRSETCRCGGNRRERCDQQQHEQCAPECNPSSLHNTHLHCQLTTIHQRRGAVSSPMRSVVRRCCIPGVR